MRWQDCVRFRSKPGRAVKSVKIGFGTFYSNGLLGPRKLALAAAQKTGQVDPLRTSDAAQRTAFLLGTAVHKSRGEDNWKAQSVRPYVSDKCLL